MPLYQDKVPLFGGELLLYTLRNTTKRTWYYRLWNAIEKKYIEKSTKTQSIDFATKTATDAYLLCKSKVALGYNPRSATYQDVYDLYVKERLSAQKADESEHSKRRQNRRRLFEFQSKKYVLPYLGKFEVSSITQRTIEEYFHWRVAFYTTGPGSKEEIPANAAITPSVVSLKMETTTIRTVLKYAYLKGFIFSVPPVQVPTDVAAKPKARRDGFSEAEFRKFKNLARSKKHTAGCDAFQKHQRESLRNMLLVIATSGLRPREVLNLEWRDIVQTKMTANGRTVTTFKLTVRAGKTGSRSVITLPFAAKFLERQKGLTGSFDLVFCDRKGRPVENWNKTLHKICDQLGIPRKTLYDARHLYCTRMIRSGCDLFTLSRNMGTGIAQIQANYSHYIVEQSGHRLTNFVNEAGRLLSMTDPDADA